jgi:hypothetical protein
LGFRIPGVLLFLSLALGCASHVALQAPEGNRWKAEQILKLHIDRSSAWESLFAALKVTVEMNESHWTASGSFQYLEGERIGIQFRQPYRFVLGDFFLTPSEFVYWGPLVAPQMIRDLDTLHLSSLLPLELPNWDLRDLIPFPLGGRTGAFRLDTVEVSGDTYVLYGRTDGAIHRLTASARRGEILRERVEHDGREPLVKIFRRYEICEGWLVPTEVTCTTEDERVSLTWKMKRPVLRVLPRSSQEYRIFQ